MMKLLYGSRTAWLPSADAISRLASMITQWNAECVKTTYGRTAEDGVWRKWEDRVPVGAYKDLEEPADCVCVVHHEHLKPPKESKYHANLTVIPT